MPEGFPRPPTFPRHMLQRLPREARKVMRPYLLRVNAVHEEGHAAYNAIVQRFDTFKDQALQDRNRLASEKDANAHQLTEAVRALTAGQIGEIKITGRCPLQWTEPRIYHAAVRVPERFRDTPGVAKRGIGLFITAEGATPEEALARLQSAVGAATLAAPDMVQNHPLAPKGDAL